MNEVEEYIEGFPPEVQERLKKVREIIHELAPEASERICMGIPTYDLNGKWLVHFAGFKKHIGFYPQPEGIEAFREQLKDFKTSKGTIQFPLNKPLPEELIGDIVKYRVEQQGR